jgi:hypothetical protein
MIIKTITYSRTKNLGNFESERLEMTAEVEEGDNPDVAAKLLGHRVNELLSGQKLSQAQKLAEELF